MVDSPDLVIGIGGRSARIRQRVMMALQHNSTQQEGTYLGVLNFTKPARSNGQIT